MVAATGKFDGKQVVFDKTPTGIPTDASVHVIFVEEGKSFALEALASLAIKGGLPPDYAAQHHHYQYGVPKR